MIRRLHIVAALIALSFAFVAAGADLQDASGTITVGATSQTLVTSNNSPRFFFFQNISADTLWINFGAAATQDSPSIKVAANGIIQYDAGYVPLRDGATIIGPNAGAKFVCKWK